MGRFTDIIEVQAMAIADGAFAMWPQPKPNKDFASCQVIAHRGVYNNQDVFENTIPAFNKAFQVPVAGIEFDLRFTKDYQVVAHHDAHLHRLFGSSDTISDLNFADLRAQFPKVPLLSEVVRAFPQKHLMIELKRDTNLDWDRASQIVIDELKGREPAKDFHLMSFAAHLFDHFDPYPAKTFLPIAKLNVSSLSDLALEKGWAGIAGHYLMISQNIIDRHHQVGQIVGIGFPSSCNSLYREVNRGADFIFTDYAPELFDQF